MLKNTWIVRSALAITMLMATAALAFQFYIKLPILENTSLVVIPGKRVWVECQMHPFRAAIEEVTPSGMVISLVDAGPVGLPCDAVGIRALGDNRYFFPFRTVLGLQIDGHKVWSNPFPM